MAELSGIDKAAILMGFLPLESAREVFKHLPPIERRQVLTAVAKLDLQDFDAVEDTVKEYISMLKGNPMGVVDSGMDRVTQIMAGILDDDLQEEIIRSIVDEKRIIFEALKNVKDVPPLVTLFANEEPQLIALVASYMAPSVASEFLSSFPREKMRDIGEAVALMGQSNPSVVAQWEKYIADKIENFNFSDASPETNGLKNIVSMLNGVTRATERVFFEALQEKNPELAKTIKENMFVFEDIGLLDARSMQKVFSTITDNEVIAKAIKTASPELREKIMAAFPQQRKEILDSELDGLGPIRREDSEEAQQKIANIVKELEREKAIVIDRGGGDVIF